MPLPIVPIPTEEFELAGDKVSIRSLSRGEALRLGQMREDPDAAETFIIATATGLAEGEVAAWREVTDPVVVEALSDRILELSGLVKGAQKRG